MAMRFGKSLALDYLQVDPPMALLIDDALHQRLLRIEQGKSRGAPPPGQRFSEDADYDDSDWHGPPE